MSERRRGRLACDVCCLCHTYSWEGEFGCVSMEQEDVLPILSVVQNLHPRTTMSNPGLSFLGVRESLHCTYALIGFSHASKYTIAIQKQAFQCIQDLVTKETPCTVMRTFGRSIL